VPRIVRIGVLDIGSNSLHLLVGEVDRDGRIATHADTKEMVRLGGSLRRGTIDPETFQAGLDAVGALLARSRAVGCARVLAVGTSVVREAENARDFLEAVRRQHDLAVRVLSGEEEARLVYLGVKGASAALGTISVLDVGGGSVEVAVGSSERPSLCRSLPIGALRLRDRLVGADGIVRRRDVAAIVDAVRQSAMNVAGEVHALSPEAFVLTAGTPRALARLAVGLPGMRSEEVLGTHVAFRLAASLVGRPPESLESLGVEPRRRDTIAVGAIVVSTLLALFGAREARIERRGLREGVLLEDFAHRRTTARSSARAGP